MQKTADKHDIFPLFKLLDIMYHIMDVRHHLDIQRSVLCQEKLFFILGNGKNNVGT